MGASVIVEESTSIPLDAIAKEISTHGKYIIQQDGGPTMVVLSLDRFMALLDELEDLTDALESVTMVSAIERGEIKTIPIEEVKRRILSGAGFDD